MPTPEMTNFSICAYCYTVHHLVANLRIKGNNGLSIGDLAFIDDEDEVEEDHVMLSKGPTPVRHIKELTLQ